MAWQTPKTNWSPEDGVTNDDFNRIEQNINHLYQSAEDMQSNILTHDAILYVSTSGNDDTGTGEASKPFRTIKRALSALPRNLGGHYAMINVSAGTYGEAIEISGFDGLIIINGSTGSTVTVNSFRVSECTCELRGINLTSRGAVFITNGAQLIGDGQITTDGYAITVNYGALLHIGTIDVSDVSSYAVEVNRAGRVYASSIAGTGNTGSIRCQSGGIAAFGSNSMSVSGTLYMTANGGRIYTGPQQSIPNY